MSGVVPGHPPLPGCGCGARRSDARVVRGRTGGRSAQCATHRRFSSTPSGGTYVLLVDSGLQRPGATNWSRRHRAECRRSRTRRAELLTAIVRCSVHGAWRSAGTGRCTPNVNTISTAGTRHLVRCWRSPLRLRRRPGPARTLPRRRARPWSGGEAQQGRQRLGRSSKTWCRRRGRRHPRTVIVVGAMSDSRPSMNDPVTLTINVPTAKPLWRFHRRPASARVSAPAIAAAMNAAAVITAVPPTEA